MNPVASGNLQSPDAGSLVDFLSAETHEVAEGVTVPPSSSSDTSPKENAVPEKTDRPIDESSTDKFFCAFPILSMNTVSIHGTSNFIIGSGVGVDWSDSNCSWGFPQLFNSIPFPAMRVIPQFLMAKEGIGASLRTEVGFGKPLYAPLSVRADFGFFNDVFIDGRVRRITRYTDVYLGLSSGIFAGAAIECNSQFEKGTVCTVQPALSLDLLRFFSR